jgi:O-antigen/teichoic acid export membrane protein
MKLKLITLILSKAITGLILLLSVPLYLKFISIEEFGIISFFNNITVFLGLLELGLAVSLASEIAKSTENKTLVEKCRNLAKTSEILYIFSNFHL